MIIEINYTNYKNQIKNLKQLFIPHKIIDSINIIPIFNTPKTLNLSGLNVSLFHKPRNHYPNDTPIVRLDLNLRVMYSKNNNQYFLATTNIEFHQFTFLSYNNFIDFIYTFFIPHILLTHSDLIHSIKQFNTKYNIESF